MTPLADLADRVLAVMGGLGFTVGMLFLFGWAFILFHDRNERNPRK